MDKNLEKLKLLTEKIYNLSSVLKEYCKTNSNNIEEVANLYSLIEYLHSNIDTLNSIFINVDLPDEEFMH